MQSIRFIKASTTPGGASVSHTLADGTKKMMVVAYKPMPDGILQDVDRPRAPSRDVYYRQNFLMVVRFTVRREFTSVGAAHTFMHRHGYDVNGRGAFVSQMGGRFTSLASGNNWVLMVKDHDPDGIGLYIHYEAMGPKMVTL